MCDDGCVRGEDLDDLAAHPTIWHPTLAELEWVELVVSGALPHLEPELAVAPDIASGTLVLEDAEGTPVALVEHARVADAPRPPAADAPRPPAAGRVVLRGSVRALRPFSHPPLRRHRRRPAQVRAALSDMVGAGRGGVLAVVVDGGLTAQMVQDVAHAARDRGAALLWLAVVGHGRRRDLPPEALLRAVREVAAELDRQGLPGLVVPVAVPAVGDAALDAASVADVAVAYGADAVLDPVTVLPVAPQLHPAFEHERERSAPAPHRRGVTVFFTGLSGSGKSTLAKALADRLLDDGRRAVTMLDGDEVRRLLSAGLGFGRADRDLNIARIGYVAAEVTRHGGVAICAPIAPFAQVRATVRARVEEVGDFVLVWVSTPLEVCEQRDRKGLYARARQGLVAEFTGISSPYEPPVDADLELDTSVLSVDEAFARLWALLETGGYLGES